MNTTRPAVSPSMALLLPLVVSSVLSPVGARPPVAAAALPASPARYQALRCFLPATECTWAIHDRDGANREVPPHLSSLGKGEIGVGVVASPVFSVGVDRIRFTVRGHDGQGGGRDRNFVALVDAATGEMLQKTHAPSNDALQDRAWDVSALKGRKVRVEAHDGLSEGAFAWIGVGSIDAGPALTVDFEKGLPEGWELRSATREVETHPVVAGGVPFDALGESFLPERGAAELPCGFTATRLFVLGGTIRRGRVLEVHGHVEIRYRDGTSERHPLMGGYTLAGELRMPLRSEACYLRSSSDPSLHYFVLAPAPKVIESLRFTREPKPDSLPLLTAVTCETAAESEHLRPLPAAKLTEEESAWIRSHSISAGRPDLARIEATLREELLPAAEAGPGIRFEKRKISPRTFEAASVADIDGDGHKDIVSGGFWYEGPALRRSHRITDVKPAGEYWDDFSDYPLDVDGDGDPDIITGAFFGGPLRWLENPGGRSGEWKVHPIADVGPIETTRFWDVDGDGVVEAVPNAGGNVIFFRLVRDAGGKGTGWFTRHVVKLGGCGHGLGFGDINGDGRGDFVVPDGWIEAPEDPLNGAWTWHDDGFRFGMASVPMVVHDVSGDGLADIIVGSAHGYGLSWHEQVIDHAGARIWIHNLVDLTGSQYHDMMLVDIDGDGREELVTGKRYRAHNGNDPGSTDPLFIRYYDIEKGVFTPHTIDEGPAGSTSGVGIYFWVEDVDGDGRKDLVAPGKEGLHLFRNRGRVPRVRTAAVR